MARHPHDAVVPDSLDSLRELYKGRFWGHIGIEFVEAAEGRAVCRVTLQEHHTNYNEVVHGGVISSLIDSAAGTAIRTLREPHEIAGRPHATSDLHVTYLAGARGTELVAEARVLRRTRSAIFAEVDVFDDARRLVARGMATFVITQGRRH